MEKMQLLKGLQNELIVLLEIREQMLSLHESTTDCDIMIEQTKIEIGKLKEFDNGFVMMNKSAIYLFAFASIVTQCLN